MQSLFKTSTFRVNISTIKLYDNGSIWSIDHIKRFYNQQIITKF